MPCVNCKRIRTAILHGKMAEAAGLTVETLREKIGFKSEEPATAVVGDAAPEAVAPEPKKTK